MQKVIYLIFALACTVFATAQGWQLFGFLGEESSTRQVSEATGVIAAILLGLAGALVCCKKAFQKPEESSVSEKPESE